MGDLKLYESDCGEALPLLITSLAITCKAPRTLNDPAYSLQIPYLKVSGENHDRDSVCVSRTSRVGTDMVRHLLPQC